MLDRRVETSEPNPIWSARPSDLACKAVEQVGQVELPDPPLPEITQSHGNPRPHSPTTTARGHTGRGQNLAFGGQVYADDEM